MNSLWDRFGGRQEVYILLAGFAGLFLGNTTNAFAPFVVQTAHSNLDVTLDLAGYIIALEFTGIAIAGLVFGPRIHLVNKTRWAIVSSALAMLLALVSSQLNSLLPLLIVRFLAGLGVGVALACGGAVLAQAKMPERGFAIVKTLVALLAALLLSVSGYVVGLFGFSGVYYMVALAALLMLPLMLFVPSSAAKSDQSSTAVSGLPHFWIGILLLAAVLNWMFFVSMPWAYLGVFGETAGLKPEQFGSVLGVGFAFGAIGGALATYLSTKAGRLIPLTLGIGVNGVTWYLICNTADLYVFVGAVFLNNLSFFFTLPYLLGATAMLDVEGRWSSLASTLFLGAVALAPVAGGILVTRFDPVTLGSITLIGELLTLVGLTLALVLFRRVSDEAGNE